MARDLWGNEEEDFNDMPEADASVQLFTPPPTPKVAASPIIPETRYEEAIQEVEEDYTDVFNDANLRIEQGRLYQMIMNHPLFDGLDADPRAVENVEREIKQFARESMEVMLGMRQTIGVPHDPTMPVKSSPFNELEVEILKAIASKASGGATQADNADEVGRSMRPQQDTAPVPPKRMTLNTIGTRKPAPPPPAPVQAQRVAPRPQPKAQPVAAKKPLQAKPEVPVKRVKTKLEAMVEQVALEEGIPKELLTEEVLGGGKPVAEMTDTEKLEHNKKAIKRRGRQVKSSDAIPMATEGQMEQLAYEQADRALKSPSMAHILTSVAKATAKT